MDIICNTVLNTDCDSGWFGSKCQFQCHCSKGCDKSGQCKDEEKCVYGWFGYKCQYKDAISYITAPSVNYSVNTNVLGDSDDSTCLITGTFETIILTLSPKIPFFFVRLVVANTDLLYKFTVYVQDANDISKRIECQRQKFTLVDKKTVDIRCEMNELVDKVILKGQGITSLCSIYVNRGRNVAVRQRVEQTSTNGSYIAEKAVDGSTDTTFSRGSCTLTENVTDSAPTWILTLDEPVVVGSFEVHNRDDSPMNYYFYGSTLLTFNTNNETCYTSLSNINKTPIEKVKITASKYQYTTAILSFCELLVFGECPPGKWDLDCKRTCKSECPNSCSEWDGSCPTSCLGSYPPACTVECPVDKWGVNCKENCSDRCQYKYCNSVDGLCTAGCNGYSDPPYCTKACENGRYGLNCLNQYQQTWMTGPSDEIKETGFQFSAVNFGIGLGACAGAALIILCVALIIMRHLKRGRKESQRNPKTVYEDINTTTSTVRYVPQPTTHNKPATEKSPTGGRNDKPGPMNRTDSNYVDCTPPTPPEESEYEVPNYINITDEIQPKL
ncbi:hypothetical protein Btru_033524 [Bulinus truncatus]|nr:hypothetical protein Btru_033524 [Bulinus truncatus]